MRRRKGHPSTAAMIVGACLAPASAGAQTGQAPRTPIREAIADLVHEDAGLHRGCRRAFRRRTAAAWCDPHGTDGAHLRAPARELRSDVAHVVRLAGDPLALTTPLSVRAVASRGAQLALIVRAGDSVGYARFGRLPPGELSASLFVRRTRAGIGMRLAARGDHRRPLVQRTAVLPRPSGPPVIGQPPLAIRECGQIAPRTAQDVAGFNQLWGSDRAGPGWTGGDVTFSTPLPDGRTAWIFGDTFIGNVTPDGRRTDGLVRNAIVVQDGACLTTHVTGTAVAPEALLRPSNPEQWYWPSDATVEDDHLHVMALRMRATGPGPWEFEILGTDLVTFDLPGLALRAIRPLPAAPSVAWGAALAQVGRRIYIYGVHQHDDSTPYLHVARTTTDLEGGWEYRSRDGWTRDASASTDQLPGVSNQLSVMRVGGGFVLITQEPWLGPLIRVHRAASPAGPWSRPGTVVAVASPPGAGTFTYNAVAHPEFTSGGRLLVSYNANSEDWGLVTADATLYRPRFITIPWPP